MSFKDLFHRIKDGETGQKPLSAQSEQSGEKPGSGQPAGSVQKSGSEQPAGNAGDMLADMTYIEDVHHIEQGGWHQWDILLAARGYGWETMVDWADYFADKELQSIQQVSVGDMGAAERNVLDECTKDGRLSKAQVLKEERGNLGVAGISTTLQAPVKVVWFNQTRILRLFTPVDLGEDKVRRFCETLIRRTFGTPDAMKLGQPLKKG